MHSHSNQEITLVKDRFYLISLRFIFSYLVLFVFPFPFYYIPFYNYLLDPLQSGLLQLTDWVGAVLFGKSYNTYNPNTGSGDTSFHYAQSAAFFLLSLIVTMLWSIIDRHRSSDQRLSVLLTTLMRFYVAATLVSYGVIKIFPLQFPEPPAMALARTYGESSPMGLLWTFMGSSRLYSAFTGAGELLAGVLLLFRSTRLIGAVLSTFVFLHVFVLNLSYDIPVKLFSLHLLLMSLFLATPLMKKTINLFATDDPTLAETVFSKWNPRKTRWILIVIKSVLVILILVPPVYSAFERNRELNAARASSKPGIAGVYTVSSFTRNHETLLDTGPSRWKEFRLSENTIEIIHGDGASVQWLSAVRSKKLRMTSKDLSTLGEFDLILEGDRLSLRGKLHLDSLSIEARRTAPYEVPLFSRGFRWVSEEPFNR